MYASRKAPLCFRLMNCYLFISTDCTLAHTSLGLKYNWYPYKKLRLFTIKSTTMQKKTGKNLLFPDPILDGRDYQKADSNTEPDASYVYWVFFEILCQFLVLNNLYTGQCFVLFPIKLCLYMYKSECGIHMHMLSTSSWHHPFGVNCLDHEFSFARKMKHSLSMRIASGLRSCEP